MQHNIPVTVRPFTSRGDQALALAGLTSTAFLPEENNDSFDMLLVTEIEIEAPNEDGCIVSKQQCLVELYHMLLRLQYEPRRWILSVGLVIERGEMQPQMLHLPICQEDGLIGQCWSLGQVLLTVLQSDQPLFELADKCRDEIMLQINSNRETFQDATLIKIACFGVSPIDVARARRLNEEVDDDIEDAISIHSDSDSDSDMTDMSSSSGYSSLARMSDTDSDY